MNGKPRGETNYGKHRTTHPDGYIRLYRPGHPLAAQDGYVLEHRFVVHESGRLLAPDEHVHHLNGDKADNRLENLQVLTEPEHQRAHHYIGTTIRNQHGEFLVVGPEARRVSQLARSHRDRKRRFAALAADPTIRPHGNASTYTNWGCRCAPCTVADRRPRKARAA